MTVLNLDDATIDKSHEYILRHNINSSDAIFLWQCLASASNLRKYKHDVIVVASDTRLLRAAQSEGLVTLNPETNNEAELAQFFA